MLAELVNWGFDAINKIYRAIDTLLGFGYCYDSKTVRDTDSESIRPRVRQPMHTYYVNVGGRLCPVEAPLDVHDKRYLQQRARSQPPEEYRGVRLFRLVAD